MTQTPRPTWSWALYDWANSAFATTVMAGFFPLFFKSYWAAGTPPETSTFYLGWANSGASIVIAAIAPFLGAIADRGSAKKRFLFAFAALGILNTAALWFVEKGDWKSAVFFFVLGTIGFMGSNTFYDALLPSVSDDETVDRVSALGFGLGYIGGGLLFALNVAMFLKPAVFGISDPTVAIRLSFILVAVWWAVFSIPLFLFVPEPKHYDALPLIEGVAAGWRQLLGTLKELKRLKVVGIFLLAYWLYIDGVDTIVRMAVDYGMALGFPQDALIIALLIVQFVAFPSAIIYGRLAGRIGPKAAILTAIVAYSFTTVLAYGMNAVWHFYALAVLLGMFQGGIQAISRSLYSRIIPANKAAEFFGFYNMLGKFAAVIGPALMGTITYVTGDPRKGILSLLLLFASGGFLLLKVDVEEGARMAKEELS
ncbi:MAG: MFS transporter [Elusimicrobia bacterium]|nr:MAG: MFS transporter [Elusimicrobiota bacterium]